MKVNSISLKRLRNAEHYQFHTEVKDLVVATTPESLNISSLFDTYLQHFQNEGIAMNMIQKSEFTNALVEADNQRDSIFRGLFDLVKSGTNHFDPAIKQAAERVMLVFNETGNISAMPYNEETAVITAVIDKLQTDYADDLTTLTATAWVEQLGIKNNAFDSLSKSRYASEAGKPDLNMREVRKEVDRSFRKIAQLINALILVNGETDYASFVNELNQRIEKFMNTLSQRKGRKATL